MYILDGMFRKYSDKHKEGMIKIDFIVDNSV